MIKILIFNTLAISLTLITTEYIFRKTNPKKPSCVIQHPNKQVSYTLRPGCRPDINRYGFRGPVFSFEKQNSIKRVVFIGDSHTQGVEVKKYKNTFVAKFRHYYKEFFDQDIEVINLGVGGHNTVQQLAILREFGLKLSPDLIILQHTVNDIALPNYIHPKYKLLNLLLHKSHLATYFYKKLIYRKFGDEYLSSKLSKFSFDFLVFEPGLVGTPGEDLEGSEHPVHSVDKVPLRYKSFVGYKNWKIAMSEFDKELRKRSIPLINIGFLNKLKEDFFSEKKLAYYSFEELFKHKRMIDYGYNPKNTADHFNEKGNDFIGKELAVKIKQMFDL